MATKLPFVLLTHPLSDAARKKFLLPYTRIKIVHSRRELLHALPRAEGLITTVQDQVDRALLQKAEQLKVIGNCAVGVDHIDLSACQDRGIQVTHTPNVLTRATAECTLALLLATARRVSEADSFCRKGKFKGWAPDLFLGLELQGRKAVIVGKGRIGQEVGRLFQALGLSVTFITRREDETQIRHHLRQAQILSLHLPLTPSNTHWLNRQRIRLLPPDAIVLNTSRGPVIEEGALIEALQKKKIFGAGLDVFEKEPLIPASLKKLPNVTLLPHLGSATELTRYHMARLAFEGCVDVLRGRAPAHPVF